MYEIVFGIHVIESIIKNNISIINKVFIKNNKNCRLKILEDKLKKKNIKMYYTNKNYLNKISKNKKNQGIVAYIKKSIYKYNEKNISEMIKKKYNFIFLILDNIQDPRNLGACLRTAASININAVIITKNKSANITPLVRKISCGAVDKIPIIIVNNLLNIIKKFKKNNINIVGLDERSKNVIYKTKMTKSIAIILGSEKNGIRNSIKKKCDYLISIPTLSIMSSLNVSVVTGICLFEIIRQRNYI
ncbi:23S rRNA (guanosine-2'-O-)-methyltransferase RlmB [Candidatus Annandia adelgestsuga]|uniref:23S rRNA (Guanosine-2'-O-)-methyltransferase RlmB n=1 Tax=Candidatus Annandia adelgestsuga TaxID=1302411 RepID=A0A3Q9CLD9_9ENTR|nr:23S rRNA (guanosine(2251)-2'-O)-methyltransferase RlmB [Candidatus Annandia adelgestsuga]AZP36278.1 23S rRNA (guanosine-2'-O-)-methyltransferase RlmB [Candidatus Annandia adelgestsuga]